MERWKALAAEGTLISLPATGKQTQVRTFTLHAVRNLAGPALSLARRTAANHGDQRSSEDQGANALTDPNASFTQNDDTLREMELSHQTRQRLHMHTTFVSLPTHHGGNDAAT